MSVFSIPRRIVERFCASQGYMVKFFKTSAIRPGYGWAFPKATYAPWETDADFQRVYQRVRHATLVDVYRCYELWQLVGQSRKVHGALLEVGVWRGGTAAIIAAAATKHGIADPVYACDTFSGVVKAGVRDSTYGGGEHSNTSEDMVRRLLHDDLDLQNIRLLTGIFPEDTGNQITESAIRFCHIDVDVYASARDIVTWVWPRLPPGGMIVFDDYGFVTTDGITALVDEMRTGNDRIVIHNLNGHGIVVKTTPMAGS